MPLILVVDDEANIVELLKFTLQKEDYRVISAPDGSTGLSMAAEYLPDLIILDIMMTGRDGFEVCRALKARPETAGIPIIMLSAKSDDIDKILGLEMGAEDYVTKPFSPRELLARIKASLRRRQYLNESLRSSGTQKELVYNNLIIRPEKYEVDLHGKRIYLSPKEFEILEVLASNPGRVFNREMLLERIWGFNELRETRTVDVHIRYLRQKIEEDPSRPVYIETVRGVGYRFNDKPPSV
ncbi:MAG: transcriptional regulator [Peptococcaceae bacterium BICA1-7]|nr:MAG: transcriptional regulator [Peptococcaceae bacterium BICA1-7]HBV98164.1 DNA-binding response regulator [Desulfotomaculum sp.]